MSVERKSINCDKLRFDSRKEAKQKAKLWNKTKTKSGLRKLKNAYFCKICLCYHVTSLSNKQAKRADAVITERMNNSEHRHLKKLMKIAKEQLKTHNWDR